MSSSATEIAETITSELEESIQTKRRLVEEELPSLVQIAEVMIRALRHGRKILIFGNGGSAADSQHIAAELVSRFRRERRALPAIALTTDTSILTAIGNDYGFDSVFTRQVEALGQEGDVALGISTSGNSPNVLNAMRMAHQLGMTTVGFTGRDGGKLKDLVDVCLCVPSQSTPRIQESHIAAGHVLCEVVEADFAPGSPAGGTSE